MLSGVYTGNASFTVPVSIRAINGQATPKIVSSQIQIIPQSNHDALDISIQGLTFIYGSLDIRPRAAANVASAYNLTFLGNKFDGSHVGIYNSFFLNVKGSVYVIDNQFTNDNTPNNSSFNLSGFEVGYVAANHFSHNKPYSSTQNISISNTTTYFVGNNVEWNYASGALLGNMSVSGTETFIFGNRFVHIAVGNESWSNFFDTQPVEFLNSTGHEQLFIRNNLFNIQWPSSIATNNTRTLSIIDIRSANHLSIENNTISVVPGDISEFSERSVFNLVTNQPGQIANNIISGFDGTIVPASTNLNVLTLQNNICFGTKTDTAVCKAEDGNITSDPLFDETTNFTLGAGSPAIDGGIDRADYNDVVDNSRNDIGVHGGPWGFAQYDSQRAQSDSPFIFPFFGTESALNSTTEAQIKVFSVARFK